MPDFSMCSNTKCPSREMCYRYRVKPSEFRQAYADYRPDDRGKCDSFSSIDGWDPRWLMPEGAIVKNCFPKKSEAGRG